MPQDLTEQDFSSDAEAAREQSSKRRVLTYDEMKAAEAAFRGEPFNPAWSAAAAQVYAGISAALTNREAAVPSQDTTESQYIPC